MNEKKPMNKKLVLTTETIRNLSDLGAGKAQAFLTSPRCTDSSCPATTCE
ncbi:hypothetical protein ACLESD_37955 [Pyxidicoccus sp. 3LFB2]